MRNAGGNLAISTPYQASSRVQHFAIPLPSFSSLLRRYEKSTLPPGEGICGRSMTAPTWNIVHLCRGGVPPPANGTGNPSPTSAAHPIPSPGGEGMRAVDDRPYIHHCTFLPGRKFHKNSHPGLEVFLHLCYNVCKYAIWREIL